jgi:hypothetical protein
MVSAQNLCGVAPFLVSRFYDFAIIPVVYLDV